jgi:hypothetical protein
MFRVFEKLRAVQHATKMEGTNNSNTLVENPIGKRHL